MSVHSGLGDLELACDLAGEPLPLRLIERTVLDSDPVRHADHAEVVDLARTPHSRRVSRPSPAFNAAASASFATRVECPRVKGEARSTKSARAALISSRWDGPIGLSVTD